MVNVVVIVPKQTLTGGKLEVERLMRDLKSQGCTVSLVPLYSETTSMSVALLGAPFCIFTAILKIISRKPSILVVTHYTTLPYALLGLVCRLKVIAFVQDFEWLFVSKNTKFQLLFKAYHLLFYSYVDCFVFGNRYLEAGFPASAKRARLFGARPQQILYPVGSLPSSKQPDQSRSGIGSILRNGWLKNQSLYYQVFSILIEGSILAPTSIAAIDMLSSSASSARFSSLGINLCSPMSPAEVPIWMASLDIFICLSIHEGFGLPPLEAMSQGAIPLVLMNGGCNAYMEAFPELTMAPNSSAMEIANKIASILSWQYDKITSYRLRVRNHAIQYFSWAAKTRQASLPAVANLSAF
jgi:glycosyltransferase involved in cell wall biosynthesis